MCKLLNLVTSDLVDEDYIRYDRTHSVSALIYGASALFAKPGQTIAPLVGTWLIARNVPGFLFSPEALLGGADVVNVRDLDSSQLSNMQDTMFTMLVYVPIVCASIQFFCWSKYNLHGRYLRQVLT